VTATADPTEAVLLAAFRRHLDGQDVDPDDDFYALGGDSIVALQVVADARAQGVAVTLRDLLHHPTVRGLAAAAPACDPAAEAGSTAEARPFDLLDPADRGLLPRGVQDAYPASALQLGLLYLSETTGDPRLYHDLIGLTVGADLDAERLRDAAGRLCARHPALRTSFDLGAYSMPLALVHRSVPPPLTVEAAADGPAADARIRAWREQALTRPPDWRQAPVLRCHAVAAPGSFRLALAVHHAVLDGWSYARLVVDLLSQYAAAVAGGPAPLRPPPPAGQREFLLLERAAVGSAEAAEFWQREADAPPLLPGRPAIADPHRVAGFPIGAELLAGLRDAARRAGTPVKSLLLGAHAAAVGRWAGRREVVLGTVASGRPEVVGAELLVGLFLNTVPMRFGDVAASWSELARAALAAERRAAAHRRYPLAHIEQRLRRPAVDVVVNVTDFHVYALLPALAGLPTSGWWAYDKNSFPVMIDVTVDSPEAGTALVLGYDPALLPPAGAGELTGLLAEALRRAAADPEAGWDG
jgi:aryl carrier-like protein